MPKRIDFASTRDRFSDTAIPLDTCITKHVNHNQMRWVYHIGVSLLGVDFTEFRLSLKVLLRRRLVKHEAKCSSAFQKED